MTGMGWTEAYKSPYSDVLTTNTSECDNMWIESVQTRLSYNDVIPFGARPI